MAGLWDRVKQAQGETDNPVPTLLLSVLMVIYAREIISNKFLVLQKINGNLRVPLDIDAQSDLNAIAVNLDNRTGGALTDYMLDVQAALLGAEAGIIESEAQFRQLLAITAG